MSPINDEAARDLPETRQRPSWLPKKGGLKVQVSSKAIQNSAYSLVLDCFYLSEIGFDFSIQHFLGHWITTLIGAGIRVVGQPNILVTLTSTL